jgi:two-component system chemotaxis response regulator CheY
MTTPLSFYEAVRRCSPCFAINESRVMKKILTVDDSASVRQMVRAVLTVAGYGVMEAKDGREALGAARGEQANMVITDLNMPVMDGLTFIRELRKLPAYSGVPIVFLSTESDASFKQEAKAAGATGWITKPFSQDQLLSVVKKLIGT